MYFVNDLVVILDERLLYFILLLFEDHLIFIILKSSYFMLPDTLSFLKPKNGALLLFVYVV
jgi:hypothetical protein